MLTDDREEDIGTYQCEFGVETRVDAKFELRGAATSTATGSTGHASELVCDTTVAGHDRRV